jgi:acyl-CoA reductase-like NAD-dependent aldehyde dehydrogenase
VTTSYPMYTSTSPASTYSPWERRRDALDRALTYHMNGKGVVDATPEKIAHTADIFDAFIAPRPTATPEETQ